MDSDVVMSRGLAGLHARTTIDRPSLWRHRPVRVRRRRSLGTWMVSGLALVMIADGVASLVLPLPTAAPHATPAPAIAATWVDIANPIHLFALSGSVFARLPLTYEARRRSIGDERQDTLTFGAFDAGTPYLRLGLHRQGAAAEASSDLLVDLARLASTDALAVTRVGLPLNLMTRFGLFDTADITVQRGATALPCLGFRLAAAGPVTMVGLACGSDSRALDRAALSCVLDRIDLVSAGDDDALRDMFVEAERRRTEDCAAGHRKPIEP